jgi:hypothetical protein
MAGGSVIGYFSAQFCCNPQCENFRISGYNTIINKLIKPKRGSIFKKKAFGKLLHRKIQLGT